MPRVHHSYARLLETLHTEVIPAARDAQVLCREADGYNSSPELKRLILAIDNLLIRADIAPSRRTTQFWNRVETKGSHMIWTGAGKDSPNGIPIVEWDGVRTTAARVAKLLLTGNKPPRGTRLKKLCDVPRCIAPGCHQESMTLPGRISNIRYDEDGRPVCKRGHVLSREPRPREKVYCSQCYQIEKAELAQREPTALDAPRNASPELPVDYGKILIPRRLAVEYGDVAPDPTPHPDSPPKPQLTLTEEVNAMFAAGESTE